LVAVTGTVACSTKKSVCLRVLVDVRKVKGFRRHDSLLGSGCEYAEMVWTSSSNCIEYVYGRSLTLIMSIGSLQKYCMNTSRIRVRLDMLYIGGSEPLMFGQLVLSSIPMPLLSQNLTQSPWIESSIDASEIGDEDVMLMMNGLIEALAVLDRMTSM
jgi:hypothetical protein